jgi:WD40 repeat protein
MRARLTTGWLLFGLVVASAQGDWVWQQPILSGQAVACSPDGQYLAAAGQGGTIALYRLSDLRLVRLLQGHTAAVNALAFSPNSQRLASAGDDGTVRLHQVSTGNLLWSINAHAGAALAIAFSPDGTLLATAGTDQNAKLWNANTGAAVRTLSGHSNAVSCLAFSPDGQQLATGSWDGTVRLWQVSTGTLNQRIDAHNQPIYALAWSPNGAMLATGSTDWSIKLWSASDGSWLRTLNGHSDAISCLRFTGDSAQLLSGSWDATLRVWNPADGSLVRTLTGHTREVLSLTLTPDGARLISGGGDHQVRLWRMSDGASLGRIGSPADTIYGVGFLAGGSIVSAGFDATLQRWNASDGSLAQSYPPQDSPILCLAVSPDGTRVATGDWNGNVVLRAMPSGTIMRQWNASGQEIKGLAFSPDGAVLATASMEGEVRLWDAAGGTLIRTLSGHAGGATAVAFSSSGTTIATGDSGGVIRLWNTNTGNLQSTLNGHAGAITHLAFSPDGARLASSSIDTTVRLWDVATSTEFMTLTGHAEAVSRVAYTPDGALLATVSWDGTLRIWNANTGALHRQLTLSTLPLYALAMSPDGQAVLIGGEQGLALAWVSGPPNQPPDAPVLVSPAPDANLTSRTPTFQVQVSDPDGDQVQATLEITDSDNRTRVLTSGLVNSGTTVSFGISAEQPLLPGTYRWRARATDARGAIGVWSETRTLTISNQPPGKPVILEPADNATVSATPTFRLRLSDPDSDAVRAIIEITGNNQTVQFETLVVGSGSEVSFTVPEAQALAPGSYTWRTKAVDLYGGESGWTAVRRFDVPLPSQPPDRPVLVSPSDGSTTTPTPTFRVRLSDPNGDQVKATIEITAQSGDVRTLETGFVASGSEASVTIPAGQPLNPGSYTWRARAQDSAGNWSDWSDTFAFTVSSTNQPPAIPTMLEPVDNATVSSTPTFRLRLSDPDGDMVSALVQVIPASGIPLEFTTDSVASGTEVRYTVSEPLMPGAYTWRARARDVQGALSDWSAPSRFTVPEPDDPPTAPELLAPAEGALTSRTPIFRLRATDPEGQPISFEIEVQAGAQTLRFTTDQVPSGAILAFPVPDTQPLPAGLLSWRARARDVSGNFSDWSAPRTLRALEEVPQRLLGIRTFALSLQPSASDPNSLGLNGIIMMRWNATAQQYVSVSQLQLGEGYFIKATTPIQPNLSGDAITGEIVLPLKPGWNLIANPSLTPIAWELDSVQVQRGSERKSLRDAQQAGWVEDYLWTWQQNPDDPMRGQYQLVYDAQALPGVAGTLEPWRAYWILAREECALVLNAGGRGRAANTSRSTPFGANWLLQIEAVGAMGSSNAVWIGTANGRAMLAHPAPAPPEGQSPVQLRLRRREGYFATDVRPVLRHDTRWSIEVEVAPSAQPQPITLRVSNLLRLPRGVNLALVEEQSGMRRPLRTSAPLTLIAPPEGGVFRFTIEPVSSRALLRLLNPSVRGGSRAGEAFTLSVAITAEAQVQVQIRAGSRTVRTLGDHRVRSAGLQQFVWDGRDDAGFQLPPGSYLAEITAIGAEGQIARAAIPILIRR